MGPQALLLRRFGCCYASSQDAGRDRVHNNEHVG